MSNKQLQFAESEKARPLKSDPVPIPTKESRFRSLTYESDNIICSSLPNYSSVLSEPFNRLPLDDSSIRTKTTATKKDRESGKSRRLRGTTSYRELDVGKLRSGGSVNSEASPLSRHHSDKKKRAYSTFDNLQPEQKSDQSESDSGDQDNDEKLTPTSKKPKSPKDQKFKYEGTSKKEQKELKKLNETAKEFFEMRNSIAVDVQGEKSPKKDSAEKIFLRKLRHQIEHLPEPKVRRKKSKLVSASIDSASVDSFKHTEQQTPLSPQVSSLKPTSSQQSPKSVSPRDTTTTQAIASLETLARAIDLTNSEHEDPHSSNGSSQHRHFGKPLTESLQVAESENVPHIVKMSCLYLREKALSAVGIFRVGRNRTELMELRRQIDEGKRIIFNEMDISVYDVADLLKMYLRELPEPPIPQTLYSEFLNVSRCPKEEQTTEIVIKKLIELLRKIPPESQDLLFDVVGLLHAIAVNSDANKMNAKNLAVVIVPCIVRSTETNDIKKMLEELSYAEMSFTYLITYFKDVFSFVVERQLQTSHNTLSKPQITVSAPKSATVTNEHETKQISASNTTESSASSTQKKNEKTTGFGKQILELEKEITDLESELLVNKEDTTALSTPDTSHSVATVVATTITNQSDSLSSTSSSSQDIRLVSPLLTTPVSDESTKISKEKSRKKKASIPQIVVNNTTQLSGTVSTSPKEKKEKSSQARAESTTEGNVLLPSPKDGDKQKKNKTDTRRSPRMRKATVSTLSPSLEVTNTKATDTNRLSKSEKRPRKNSSPSKKSLSGEFLLSKNSKASPQTEPSAVEHNETSLQTSNTSNSNTTTKDFGVITSSENSTKKHILTVEQPKTIILIVEQWSCERNDTSEVVECYLSNWSIKLTRQQSLTRLIQKVIAHAQTISNLLKSPDFDPGSLKDNIYAVVSYSREFSRFLKNEQHRKLIAKGIRTLLEKAIQMLQNLSSNNSKNSVLILTATTDLLRALTFAINNSK